jgi:hypothetical protein
VEGHCLAYASLTPYFPLIELIRDFCRVTEAESPEVVAARLRRRLRGLRLTPEPEPAHLLELMGVSAMSDRLGLDSGALKAKTFQTLRQILLGLSHRRPIVLAVENVHWIDRARRGRVRADDPEHDPRRPGKRGSIGSPRRTSACCRRPLSSGARSR